MRTRKLFSLGKGFTVLMILAALLTIFHQMSYSYIPLFTQYLIKTLETKNPNQVVNLPSFVVTFIQSAGTLKTVILYIAISLLLLQVLRFLMRFFESWVKGYLLEKMAENMRLRAYKHIQSLDYTFHNKADSGDLIQRVTSDIDTTTSFLAQRTLEIVGLLATLTFGAYQLYYINPTIVWVTLGLTPISAIASIIYFMNINKLYTKIEEEESQMMTVIQENLSGSKVVRAFANEAFEIKKLEEKNSKFRNSIIKANKIIAIFWGSMDFLGVIQYLIVIGFGIQGIKQGTMDAADIIAALGLVGMLIWPIRGLGRMINDYGKALVASDRLNEIFDQHSEYEHDGTQTPDIHGSIVFQNVHFKFPDTEEHLLKNISFEIKQGETVAIIGRTGSGKTTLVNLLLRMYDYDKGNIMVDGVPLLDIQKQHIRKHIGVVMQDPFLYSKTVYQNIAIQSKNIEKEKIQQAAVIAALEKDIHTFKQGYDTLVGEKGTTLSGGQKQRVAIARVLVDDKPILIFDDALSAVDTHTDLMIRRALNQKEKKQTTIIITHRITTAKEADKIVVLEAGEITAIGTHESLSRQDGLYKKLWDIQGKLEEEFNQLVKRGDSNGRF